MVDQTGEFASVPEPIHQSSGKSAAYVWEPNDLSSVAFSNEVILERRRDKKIF